MIYVAFRTDSKNIEKKMKFPTLSCLTSLLLLLLSLLLFDVVKCANEEDNPVAFLMFEHNELCKETFVKEQKLIENLRSIRRMLDERRSKIKAFAQGINCQMYLKS